MADMTKAQLADLVLEHIGVKSVHQGSDGADNLAAQKAVQSCYEQLAKRSLCPFLVSAVPEWAQHPLAKYVAVDLSGAFGVTGEDYMRLQQDRRDGLRELQTSTAGYRHGIPTRSRFF